MVVAGRWWKQRWHWILPDEAYAAGQRQWSSSQATQKEAPQGPLHPINSDYDLYSMGKDGETVLPLTAKEKP